MIFCILCRASPVSIMMVMVNPRMSFTVKYAWNGILSVSLFSPSGLFDPVWCRNSRWMITIATIRMVLRSGVRRIVLVLRCLLRSLLILIVRFLFLCMGWLIIGW